MASENSPAIVARGVHMEYRSLAERRMNGLRDRLGGTGVGRELRIHAVRGVSLQVKRGETLGLIGHNGSGKSTLLRGLAGLHPLSQGTVHASARPQLLGINAALNKKVSGRRNLILGCLAQGLSTAEARRRLPELIEFTGLGEFIDLPMGAYSTGMRTRLSFTVATVTTPEILFMDEAMAGGDRDFKDRARKRLRQIQDNSGAVIIVSHNLNLIEQLCRRAIWMEQGKIIKRGSAAAVIEAYNNESGSPVGGAMNARRARRRARRAGNAATAGTAASADGAPAPASQNSFASQLRDAATREEEQTESVPPARRRRPPESKVTPAAPPAPPVPISAPPPKPSERLDLMGRPVPRAQPEATTKPTIFDDDLVAHDDDVDDAAVANGSTDATKSRWRRSHTRAGDPRELEEF